MSQRIVILGGGFGGVTLARILGSRRDALLDVTVVNRENYSLFTPMLPEVASGAIEPRHIAQPIRAATRGATFVLGDVQAVDFGRRTVATLHPVTGETSTIPYDQLVIALGAVSSTHGVPGAATHSFPLKALDDAMRLRHQIIRCFEAAAAGSDERERRRLLSVAVVGGGFTGVEAAGETLAYLRSIRRHYPKLDGDDVRVILIAGSGRLLEQLPARFGRCAQRMLAARGVDVVLDDDVASVDAGGVTLKSGARHETRTTVWSAGVRVPEIVAQLDVPHDEHHAVEVRADLSVPGRAGVWALGDCAHVPKPGGGAYPQTAQHAVREGTLLARNIVATLRGRKTCAFRYRSAGMMASLGDREGLADLFGRAMITGLPAWLLWRAYYLSRLTGSYRKTRVALDWALSLPFPADTANIG